MGRAVRVAVAGLLAASALACGRGGQQPQQPADTIDIAGETAVDGGSADLGDATTFRIEAADFHFSPTVITGSPGQEVELTVTNPTGTLHNFTVEGEGIDEELPAGAEASVTVELEENGLMVFWCSYHRDRGMLGAFVPGAEGTEDAHDHEETAR